MALKHAPRRTTALPASLREELVGLGHLPKPGKGKLGRKERRKSARNDGSAARAEHFANKKRKAQELEGQEQEQDDEREGGEGAGAPSSSKNAKKSKVEQKGTMQLVKMTPLERLLAKQEGTLPSEVQARKKNKVETVEDKEIAWLEAKLGVRGGPPTAAAAKDKGKWKDEFQEDGLDGELDDAGQAGGSKLISPPPNDRSLRGNRRLGVGSVWEFIKGEFCLC